jgi:hypothetical protein
VVGLRIASLASARAASARMRAPMIWPPQMTSRDFVLMSAHYSGARRRLQRH